MQYKLSTLESCELKFESSGTFTGYASKFNGIDSYGDTVLKGAYAETLRNRERPVAMFFNHQSRRSDMPAKIGVWESFEEDDYGLKATGKLTLGHPTADAVLASMKSGALSGLSIGYKIPNGGSRKEGKLRLLERIDLVEVSLVDDPADMGAQIDRSSIKSAVDDMKTLADAEEILRDVGRFSQSAAMDFVSKLRTIATREAAAGVKSDELDDMVRRLNSLTFTL